MREMGDKISIAHYPIPYDTPSEAEVFPVKSSQKTRISTTNTEKSSFQSS
jgi:hypothetical protein